MFTIIQCTMFRNLFLIIESSGFFKIFKIFKFSKNFQNLKKFCLARIRASYNVFVGDLKKKLPFAYGIDCFQNRRFCEIFKNFGILIGAFGPRNAT